MGAHREADTIAPWVNAVILIRPLELKGSGGKKRKEEPGNNFKALSFLSGAFIYPPRNPDKKSAVCAEWSH